MKKYLKFVIAYCFLPTTMTFYFLEEYLQVDVLVSYIIACGFWGSVLYFYNKNL